MIRRSWRYVRSVQNFWFQQQSLIEIWSRFTCATYGLRALICAGSELGTEVATGLVKNIRRQNIIKPLSKCSLGNELRLSMTGCIANSRRVMASKVIALSAQRGKQVGHQGR